MRIGGGDANGKSRMESSLLLLNFAHPLTEAQLERIAALASTRIEALEVRAIHTRFDAAQPFGAQATALAESIGLSAQAWQTQPMLVNLPGHSAIAAALLAEIEGRRGHLPDVVRLRPIEGAMPAAFEVAELIALYAQRRAAAGHRR
jgi:hypothetical protein